MKLILVSVNNLEALKTKQTKPKNKQNKTGQKGATRSVFQYQERTDSTPV